MKKLYRALTKFLKENFTLTELYTFQKMLRNGQGLSTLFAAIDAAIESKESEEK